MKALVTDLYGLGDFTNAQRLAQWQARYAEYQAGRQRRFRLLIINATHS